MMEYKGYTAKVEFDNEAGIFHGQVINIRDVVTFQGTSVEEIRDEFIESVEDYLEFCAEQGKEPEKPFSGRFVVRIDPSLHKEITIAAIRAGKSLNAWVGDVLQKYCESTSTKNNEVELPVVSERYTDMHFTTSQSSKVLIGNFDKGANTNKSPVYSANSRIPSNGGNDNICLGAD